MTTLFRSRSRGLHRATGLPLAAEIAIVLAIKVTLLFALAHLFFADPEAKHMRMDSARVARHLLTSR